MNNTINTGIEEAPQKAPVPVSKMPPFLAKISGWIPPQVKEILAKFYTNKKIFWPVTIVFGILFLVIILGLLFGSPNAPVQVVKRATPSPFVQPTPAPCSPTDQLCLTGNQLKDLKNQINSVDLRQSRLSPPQIDYDIKF